jgi:hypothetical protein
LRLSSGQKPIAPQAEFIGCVESAELVKVERPQEWKS